MDEMVNRVRARGESEGVPASRSEEKRQKDRQARTEKARAFKETERDYQAFLEAVEAYGTFCQEEERLQAEIKATARERASFKEEWDRSIEGLVKADAGLEAYEASIGLQQKKHEGRIKADSKRRATELERQKNELEHQEAVFEKRAKAHNTRKANWQSGPARGIPGEEGRHLAELMSRSAMLDEGLLSFSQRRLMRLPIEDFCAIWAGDRYRYLDLVSRLEATPFFHKALLLREERAPRTTDPEYDEIAEDVGNVARDYLLAFMLGMSIILWLLAENALAVNVGSVRVVLAGGSICLLIGLIASCGADLVPVGVGAGLLAFFATACAMFIPRLGAFLMVVFCLVPCAVLLVLLMSQGAANAFGRLCFRSATFRKSCLKRVYRHANDGLASQEEEGVAARNGEVGAMIVGLLRIDEAVGYLWSDVRAKEGAWIEDEGARLEKKRQELEQSRRELEGEQQKAESERDEKLREAQRWAQEERHRVDEQRSLCREAMKRLDREHSWAKAKGEGLAVDSKNLEAWRVSFQEDEKALEAKARELGLGWDETSTKADVLDEFDRLRLRPLQERLTQVQARSAKEASNLEKWVGGDRTPSLAREVDEAGNPRPHAFRFRMERRVCVFPLAEGAPRVVAHEGRPLWRACADRAEVVEATQALWRAFTKTVPKELLRFVVIDPVACVRHTLRNGDLGAKIAGCCADGWVSEGAEEFTYLFDSTDIRAFDESLYQRIIELAVFRGSHEPELAKAPQEGSDFERVNYCKTNLFASPNPLPYYVTVFIVPSAGERDWGSSARGESPAAATACGLVAENEGWRNGLLPIVLTVGNTVRGDWAEFVQAVRKFGVSMAFAR